MPRPRALGVIALYTGHGDPIDRIERLVFADSMDMNNSLNELRTNERFGPPSLWRGRFERASDFERDDGVDRIDGGRGQRHHNVAIIA